MVADPSIKTAADLKGKKVAIGSAGDTQDRMITMFAERGGVSSRDIIRIAVGADTSTRILAIKSGNVHATTVDPGGLVFAQKEGLVSLGFLGDLFPMPFQGFVTTDRKIRDNPAQIKRWLKARDSRFDVRPRATRRSGRSRYQETSTRQSHPGR